MTRLMIVFPGAFLAVVLMCACSRDAPDSAATDESSRSASIASVAPAATPTRIEEPSAREREEEPVIPGLVAWWTRPDIGAVLQLSEIEAKEIAGHLRNLELSYQLAQTRLRDARQEQTRMIEDADVAGAEILSFHRQRLQTLSTEALELNIAARVWVRERLSPDQKAAILKRSPGFFRARWFRPARMNVREGEVRNSKP